MCLIIDQPAGHVLSRARVADIARRNAHGFGAAFAENGRLFVARFVPRKPEECADYYAKHLAGRRCVIHWRMATSGPQDAAHAHPFTISDRLVVMHNGILAGGTSTESDTALFVRTVLRPMLARDHSVLRDPAVRTMLSGLVRGSRLVFVASDGEVTRIGDSGVDVKGAWYSNTYAWDADDGTRDPRIGRSYVWRDDALVPYDDADLDDRYVESLRRRAASIDDRPVVTAVADRPSYRPGKRVGSDDVDLFSWARSSPIVRRRKGAR